MSLRSLFTLILFCLMPFFPWWTITSIALISVIVFPNYWESVVIFLLYDLVFGLPAGWLGTQFTFTTIFIVIYLLVEGFRDSFNFSHL